MDVVERVLGEGITLRDQEKLVEMATADIERQAAGERGLHASRRSGENRSRCLGARACKGLRRRHPRGLGGTCGHALRTSSRAFYELLASSTDLPGRWRTP